MNYRIAIGADHRGFALKQALIKHEKTAGNGITWIDTGTFSSERTDYPQFAQKVVELIRLNKADLGVLACGSGIGIAIAANRHPNIYAGVVWNVEVARSAKEDDNVNILVFPADFMTHKLALECLEAWLTATFKGGRYQHRLEMLETDG